MPILPIPMVPLFRVAVWSFSRSPLRNAPILNQQRKTAATTDRDIERQQREECSSAGVNEEEDSNGEDESDDEKKTMSPRESLNNLKEAARGVHEANSYKRVREFIIEIQEYIDALSSDSEEEDTMLKKYQTYHETLSSDSLTRRIHIKPNGKK
jgi:hypothetical protein